VFSGDSLIITSTPSGVQKYNRFTKKWQNLGFNVEAVSITPSLFYAATREEGLFKSTDIGKTCCYKSYSRYFDADLYVLAINDDTICCYILIFEIIRWRQLIYTLKQLNLHEEGL
jgi:hypothetical protein